VGDALRFILGTLYMFLWAYRESKRFRILVLLLLMREWETIWCWLRYLTWDTKIGWWANAHPYRRYLLSDLGPVRREILVRDIDMDGKEYVEKFWVDLEEMSEVDLRRRMKFLTEPGSDEDSRRGRSSRGRSDFHPERMRQYNMEKSVVDWNLVYPRTIYDRPSKTRSEHPKAQQPRPVSREEMANLPASVSEQINDEIDDLNAPPEELPEVRDENGNVEQEAVESPMVPS